MLLISLNLRKHILGAFSCFFISAYSQEFSNTSTENLIFPVGKSFVIYDYDRNTHSFDHLNSRISEILSSGEKVSRIDIMGYCSPEGNYEKNNALAVERADKISNYLRAFFPSSDVRVTSVAEDWDGLSGLLSVSSPEWKSAVTRICKSYASPSEKEKMLRSLSPDVYNTLKRDYFPRLRRTEIRIVTSPAPEKSDEVFSSSPSSDAISSSVSRKQYNVRDVVSAVNSRMSLRGGSHYSVGVRGRACPSGPVSYRRSSSRRSPCSTSFPCRPRFGIGTNLLLWSGIRPDFKRTVFIPNIYAEYYFLDRWSVRGEFSYSNRSYSDGEYFQGLSSYVLEPRLWVFGNGCFRGLYIGPYFQYGDFNDRSSLGNYTGTYHSEGLSLGVMWPVYHGITVELGVRGGYRHSKGSIYDICDTEGGNVCNRPAESFSNDGISFSNLIFGVMYRF